MIVSSMYYGLKQIVAVYLGTELIYSDRSSIRGKLDVELDAQGNVVSFRVIPISSSPEMSIGIEASTSIKPPAMMSPEGIVDFDVDPHEIYTPEAARVGQVEDGVNLSIEADIYVYSKADMVLDEGVTFKMEVVPTARTSAPVEDYETELSVDLATKTSVSTAVYNSPKADISLGVHSNINNPEAIPFPASADTGLSTEANIQALSSAPVSTEPEVELSIEAIVTVLPVAAVTAELNATLDADAGLLDANAWIYPEETENYLHIRQVCNIVDDKS